MHIQICTTGYVAPTTITALSFMQPVYELAIDDINEGYNGSVKFEANFITESRLSSCVDVLDNAERLAAQWYYSQQRNPNKILVLSPPGK